MRLRSSLPRLAVAAVVPAILSVAFVQSARAQSTDGYLTVWPCGRVKPLASNVNYAAGQTIPNVVVSGVGAGGRICVSSYAATDVVIDLAGAWTASRSRTSAAGRS